VGRNFTNFGKGFNYALVVACKDQDMLYAWQNCAEMKEARAKYISNVLETDVGALDFEVFPDNGSGPTKQPDQNDAAWDTCSEKYDTNTAPLNVVFAEIALQKAGLPKSSVVMDLCAGTGTLTFPASKYFDSVVAVDFSAGMLNVLSRHVAKKGIQNIKVQKVDDAAKLTPFADSTFDAVFSSFGIIFADDRAAVLKEISRVLKPNGKIILATWGAPSKQPFLSMWVSELKRLFPFLTLPSNPTWTSYSDPAVIDTELKAANYTDISITTHDENFVYPSAKAYAEFSTGASSPGVLSLLGKLTSHEKKLLAEAVEKVAAEKFGEGPVTLLAQAHVAVANNKK
jgi:ubiquinone/menaquinone biosynthesis C-methylase UbiE